MKLLNSKWLFLAIALVLVSTASNLEAPTFSTKNFNFDLTSTYGDRDNFDFAVLEAGCIIAQVKPWTRSGNSGATASQLALILNGSDRVASYARVDGSTSTIVPLWTSYTVTSTQVSRVTKWTISIVNFTKSGTAKGIITLDYPPAKTPCEFKAGASRTKGRADISWLYSGKPFNGSFLVERSTDGKTWGSVSACKKPAPTTSTTTSRIFTCSDSSLKSLTTYYYHACAITSGSKCTTTDLTPTIGVKIP